MERIKINTGLSRFIMVDAITDMGTDHITGEIHLSNADPTLLLESLAQLAGLHIRHSLDFTKHAFLVKIAKIPLPADESLNGNYRLHGKIVSRSENAFSYQLEASQKNHLVIHGLFLFGVIDYNNDFQKELLQKHYQKVFECLKSR
jgi:hypothetical protein